MVYGGIGVGIVRVCLSKNDLKVKFDNFIYINILVFFLCFLKNIFWVYSFMS